MELLIGVTLNDAESCPANTVTVGGTVRRLGLSDERDTTRFVGSEFANTMLPPFTNTPALSDTLPGNSTASGPVDVPTISMSSRFQPEARIAADEAMRWPHRMYTVDRRSAYAEMSLSLIHISEPTRQ